MCGLPSVLYNDVRDLVAFCTSMTVADASVCLTTQDRDPSQELFHPCIKAKVDFGNRERERGRPRHLLFMAQGGPKFWKMFDWIDRARIRTMWSVQ